MKLTEKLEKIGNKATKQWVAVAAAFILVFPAAGAFGTGNMPVAEARLRTGESRGH